MHTVAAFYRFLALPDPAALRDELRSTFASTELLGTTLIAPEGINGTMAGSPATIDQLLNLLADRTGLYRSEVKFSTAEAPPFRRLKFKLKREIITFRNAAVDPARPGQYVDPAHWNALLADPEVLLLDTRNTYETALGTFAGAVTPPLDTFSDFSDYVRQHLDPAQPPQGRDVLHRRHPLRKGLGLHAPAGLPRGLPPQRRHPEIPRNRSHRIQPMARRLLHLRRASLASTTKTSKPHNPSQCESHH